MTTTVEVKRVRASAFPLLCKCPASQAPGHLQVDYSDDVGEGGKEIHRGLAMRLRGKPSPELDVESEEMIDLGLEWINGKNPIDPHTEMALSDEFGSGTIDVCWFDKDGAAWVCDFKTGYRDDDFWAQTMRYAHLFFQKFPTVETINLCVIWLRKEGVDFKQVTRDWIMAWFDETVRNSIQQPDSYCPGDHCARCRRRVDCPALAAVNRQTALAFCGEPISITLENFPKFYTMKKQIEQVLKNLDEMKKMLVDEHGSIPLGNGKELRTLEIHKTPISLMPALPVLQASGLSDETISDCCRISKTDLMEAIGAKAAKGMKKKSQEALMAKLEAAGAVEETIETQVREMLVRD